MSRNVIYEIGRVRVWYEDGEVHFEIFDSVRRLETFIYARDEMPYLFHVLFDIYNTFLSEYMKKLNEKREELHEMLLTVMQRIEEAKKKHDKIYVKELEKKKEDLGKRIDKINEMEKLTKDLSDELVRTREFVITFKEMSDKVFLGREW